MADWKIGTLKEARMVAANVKSLIFVLPDGDEQEPGQHYDIRLTAPDGYQAERSYSIASPPEEKGEVEFGIQLLENGEVSPYLYQMKPGDQIELRGPIGGHFIWNVGMPGPLVLIGGGSGMVPLMCMLRHYVRHAAQDPGRKIIFLASARTIEHILYRQELIKIAEEHPSVKIVFTITDTPPPGWTGYTRRIDRAMFEELFGEIKNAMPLIYVCGPTPFVEVGAGLLLDLGVNAHAIKTERFGG